MFYCEYKGGSHAQWIGTCKNSFFLKIKWIDGIEIGCEQNIII
jgi:hypothetical protein